MKQLTKKQIKSINENFAFFDFSDVDENASVLDKTIAEFYLTCHLYTLINSSKESKIEELLWSNKQKTGFKLLEFIKEQK